MPRFMPWRLCNQEKSSSGPSRKSFAIAVARAPLVPYAPVRRNGKKARRAMTNVRALTEGDALTITVDMADEVKELQERAERVRVQWEENEWYLGEARATVGRLDEQLDALRE